MCGRFTLTGIPDSLAEDLELDGVPDLEPRYNIAPTQEVLVVRPSDSASGSEAAMLRWGLVPAWSPGPAGAPLINARSESIDTKPSFRESFERRRCLVPADGYFEWKAAGGYKQPYHIRLRSRGLFLMAGVWDCWKRAGTELQSCAIATTSANELTSDIHDRMPVVLATDAARAWLDPATDRARLSGMLQPFASELMEIEAVSPLVNSVSNDGPECLRPAEVNLELEL